MHKFTKERYGFLNANVVNEEIVLNLNSEKDIVTNINP